MIDTAARGQGMRGAGEPSENAVMAFDTAEGINQILGDVLGTIDQVTSFPPSWQRRERKALWGPWIDGDLEGRLWVHQDLDGSYDWAFEFRNAGEEAWAAPIAGEIAAGSDETASSGGMVIDVGLLDSFGEGVGARGVMALDYTIDAAGATGFVAMEGFAEELGNADADAIIEYTTTEGDGGSIDFVAVADVSEPQNGTEETVAMSSRWQGDGAGRTDAVITGGDVGVLTFFETDCWDPSLSTVYFENSYELRREGDEAACVFAAPDTRAD
jgi:hypothetical protein